MMLEVANLTRRFGGFTAVSRVSFALEEGEILGLIGPNGSGKSTTFNMIAGMLRPTEGSIRFAGEEIGGLKPVEICHRGIGRTFQIPAPSAASASSRTSSPPPISASASGSRAPARRPRPRRRWRWSGCPPTRGRRWRGSARRG